MELPPYKQEFIHFLIEQKALQFGQFTLKSGRVSPYFINAGNFNTGEAIARLGAYYAAALVESGADFDVIFGPAYKGIPLAVATAQGLFTHHKKNVGFSFNRKEAKDHGEGGVIVGAPLTADSKVIIIDDVITAGTAMRQTLDIFKSNGNPKVAGIMIMVDRMERGNGEKSAIQELETELGTRIYSILTVVEIMEYLHNKEINGTVVLGDELYEKMKEYRGMYGV